jgi:hypothetical protein
LKVGSAADCGEERIHAELLAPCLLQRAWSAFRIRKGAVHGLREVAKVVWENEFGELACVLAAFAAGDIALDLCLDELEARIRPSPPALGTEHLSHGLHTCRCQSPSAPAEQSSGLCFCERSSAASACRQELHLWHASWQRAHVNRTVDFNNSFGFHALPADDSAFRSIEFEVRGVRGGVGWCYWAGARYSSSSAVLSLSWMSSVSGSQSPATDVAAASQMMPCLWQMLV